MDALLPLAGTVVTLRDSADGLEVLLLRRPDRASFAGGWVFPGGVVEPGDRAAGADEVEHARRAGIRETAEETGLSVSDLVPLSHWHPPLEAPKRIRTWFFLARDQGGQIAPAPDEVVGTLWTSPAEALRRHAAGELTLFPPTWVTLHLLSGFHDVDAAFADATEPRMYSTQLLGTGQGVFVWEGDAEHRGSPVDGGRHRLETASLPWRYVRS